MERMEALRQLQQAGVEPPHDQLAVLLEQWSVDEFQQAVRASSGANRPAAALCRRIFNERRPMTLPEAVAKVRAENKQDQQGYQDPYQDPAWRHMRWKVLRRAGGLCEGCLEREATEVHHVAYTPDKLGSEPAFNLRALCSPCHRRIHGGGQQSQGGAPRETRSPAAQDDWLRSL